jgi:predicted transcriptional regulator
MMPCKDSSGELTEIARKILAVMADAVPLSEVAEKTGLPLYRIRSAARELAEAGLAEEKNGNYVATEAGRAANAAAPGRA